MSPTAARSPIDAIPDRAGSSNSPEDAQGKGLSGTGLASDTAQGTDPSMHMGAGGNPPTSQERGSKDNSGSTDSTNESEQQMLPDRLVIFLLSRELRMAYSNVHVFELQILEEERDLLVLTIHRSQVSCSSTPRTLPGRQHHRAASWDGTQPQCLMHVSM